MDEAGARASEARARMVADQLRRRDIRDERVLAAMGGSRARHSCRRTSGAAYSDGPLPIGGGQTISQPYIVARMTELLAVGPGDRVLDIGTGSGTRPRSSPRSAASSPRSSGTRTSRCGQIASPASAMATGSRSVRATGASGRRGAPWDGIVVAAGAPAVPVPLREQLGEGRRLVIPVGGLPSRASWSWSATATNGGSAPTGHASSCRSSARPAGARGRLRERRREPVLGTRSVVPFFRRIGPVLRRRRRGGRDADLAAGLRPLGVSRAARLAARAGPVRRDTCRGRCEWGQGQVFLSPPFVAHVLAPFTRAADAVMLRRSWRLAVLIAAMRVVDVTPSSPGRRSSCSRSSTCGARCGWARSTCSPSRACCSRSAPGTSGSPASALRSRSSPGRCRSRSSSSSSSSGAGGRSRGPRRVRASSCSSGPPTGSAMPRSCARRRGCRPCPSWSRRPSHRARSCGPSRRRRRRRRDLRGRRRDRASSPEPPSASRSSSSFERLAPLALVRDGAAVPVRRCEPLGRVARSCSSRLVPADRPAVVGRRPRHAARHARRPARNLRDAWPLMRPKAVGILGRP